MNFLLWYLATITALPIALAAILWLARKDMRRTITALSLLTLGLGLSSATVFTVELKSIGVSLGTSAFSAVNLSGSDSELLIAIQEWRAISLEAIVTLQSAAWVLAFYDAVQSRRGRWLALLAVSAAFSSLLMFFASNVNLTSVILFSPQLINMVDTHPFAVFFAIDALPLLAAAATLLYSQVGLRTSMRSGLVPGAVRVPSGAEQALASIATMPRDDEPCAAGSSAHIRPGALG